jgi:hypothetical protein
VLPRHAPMPGCSSEPAAAARGAGCRQRPLLPPRHQLLQLAAALPGADVVLRPVLASALVAALCPRQHILGAAFCAGPTEAALALLHWLHQQPPPQPLPQQLLARCLGQAVLLPLLPLPLPEQLLQGALARLPRRAAAVGAGAGVEAGAPSCGEARGHCTAQPA